MFIDNLLPILKVNTSDDTLVKVLDSKGAEDTISPAYKKGKPKPRRAVSLLFF